MKSKEKILSLSLNAKLFEMVATGVITEVYCEIKKYWCKRLARCIWKMCWWRDSCGECCFRNTLFEINRFEYSHVLLRCGSSGRCIKRPIESIIIGRGKPEWGASSEFDVFIIKF